MWLCGLRRPQRCLEQKLAQGAPDFQDGAATGIKQLITKSLQGKESDPDSLEGSVGANCPDSLKAPNPCDDRQAVVTSPSKFEGCPEDRKDQMTTAQGNDGDVAVLRAVLNQLSYPITLFDNNSSIILQNDASRRIWGDLITCRGNPLNSSASGLSSLSPLAVLFKSDRDALMDVEQELAEGRVWRGLLQMPPDAVHFALSSASLPQEVRPPATGAATQLHTGHICSKRPGGISAPPPHLSCLDQTVETAMQGLLAHNLKENDVVPPESTATAAAGVGPFSLEGLVRAGPGLSATIDSRTSSGLRLTASRAQLPNHHCADSPPHAIIDLDVSTCPDTDVSRERLSADPRTAAVAAVVTAPSSTLSPNVAVTTPAHGRAGIVTAPLLDSVLGSCTRFLDCKPAAAEDPAPVWQSQFVSMVPDGEGAAAAAASAACRSNSLPATSTLAVLPTVGSVGYHSWGSLGRLPSDDMLPREKLGSHSHVAVEGGTEKKRAVEEAPPPPPSRESDDAGARPSTELALCSHEVRKLRLPPPNIRRALPPWSGNPSRPATSALVNWMQQGQSINIRPSSAVVVAAAPTRFDSRLLRPPSTEVGFVTEMEAQETGVASTTTAWDARNKDEVVLSGTNSGSCNRLPPQPGVSGSRRSSLHHQMMMAEGLNTSALGTLVKNRSRRPLKRNMSAALLMSSSVSKSLLQTRLQRPDEEDDELVAAMKSSRSLWPSITNELSSDRSTLISGAIGMDGGSHAEASTSNTPLGDLQLLRPSAFTTNTNTTTSASCAPQTLDGASCTLMRRGRRANSLSPQGSMFLPPLEPTAEETAVGDAAMLAVGNAASTTTCRAPLSSLHIAGPSSAHVQCTSQAAIGLDSVSPAVRLSAVDAPTCANSPSRPTSAMHRMLNMALHMATASPTPSGTCGARTMSRRSSYIDLSSGPVENAIADANTAATVVSGYLSLGRMAAPELLHEVTGAMSAAVGPPPAPEAVEKSTTVSIYRMRSCPLKSGDAHVSNSISLPIQHQHQQPPLQPPLNVPALQQQQQPVVLLQPFTSELPQETVVLLRNQPSQAVGKVHKTSEALEDSDGGAPYNVPARAWSMEVEGSAHRPGSSLLSSLSRTTSGSRPSASAAVLGPLRVAKLVSARTHAGSSELTFANDHTQVRLSMTALDQLMTHSSKSTTAQAEAILDTQSEDTAAAIKVPNSSHSIAHRVGNNSVKVPSPMIRKVGELDTCGFFLTSANLSTLPSEHQAYSCRESRTGLGARASHGPPPPHAQWYEVTLSQFTHPSLQRPVVMMVQNDVSARVWAEHHVARVMEAEHALLENIFPIHVIQHIAATAAQAAEVAESEEDGHYGAAAQPSIRHSCAGAMSAMNYSPGCSPGVAAACGLTGGVPQLTGESFLHLATSHNALTLLFCDIQGFTTMCNSVKPVVVMSFLNDLYTRLDALLDGFGVYKVETIGDCYVAAGGLMKVDEETGAVTVRSDDVDPLHAHRTVQFAKALLRAAAAVRLPTTGEPVRLRVGIHSGSAMSGVVGTRMPRFCLFGDTINTASRMESTGVPGAIHVSKATRDLVPEEDWEATGGVQAKGKGTMETFLLRSLLDA